MALFHFIPQKRSILIFLLLFSVKIKSRRINNDVSALEDKWKTVQPVAHTINTQTDMRKRRQENDYDFQYEVNSTEDPCPEYAQINRCINYDQTRTVCEWNKPSNLCSPKLNYSNFLENTKILIF